MRDLTPRERSQVKALSARAIEFALIEPTKTGLNKSILDATGPVRTFLREKNLHNYDGQSQGPSFKKHLTAYLVSEDGIQQSNTSLYRPVTKSGDPRIWFSGLKNFASASDLIAIVTLDGELYLLNLTTTSITNLAARSAGPISKLILNLERRSNAVAEELLGRLRTLAEAGPIKSVMEEYADTAIGRTIETALGIKINSRREPDYKGIEIKSSRITKSGNKHTLFAKVPDWDISKLKSSGEILDSFGYPTEKDFRLYCTVSARAANPQSLYLKLNKSEATLDERSNRAGRVEVATWRLSSLQRMLQEKHAETFWISATTERVDGVETFQIRSVKHTRSPIMSQFELLLSQGDLTVDHLIKRTSRGVREGGPLFKVSRKAFPLLFPPSRTYDLA